MRAGQEGGAEGSGGPFPPQNAPSRVWLTHITPPNKPAPPRLPMAGSLRAGRGGDGGAGQGPCRAGLCGMRCGGQRPQLAQCRAPLASGGERGGDVPACLRRPGGPARPRTARHGPGHGGAEQRRPAPTRHGSGLPSGAGGPGGDPRGRGGLRFCSSSRPACCSRVLRFRCPTQPRSPDVRSFLLFAASSQPGMRSYSIARHRLHRVAATRLHAGTCFNVSPNIRRNVP